MLAAGGPFAGRARRFALARTSPVWFAGGMSAHRRMALAACSTSLLASSSAAQDLAAPAEPWLIREVEVISRDVFSEEEAAERRLYRFFNALHVPTREKVVARELWFGEGDVVGEDQRAELERNLRAAGLFGEAEVRFEPTGEPGEADLVVETHDRFSLMAVASGSTVGGVSGYYGRFGEANLFGSGDSVAVVTSGNDDGERYTALDYFDRHLFGSWHELDVTVGETDEGPFGFLSVTRPVKHLRDPYSWGLRAGHEDAGFDYYLGSESVAEVQFESTSVEVFLERTEGPPELRRTLGIEARAREATYEPSTGLPVAIPGDLTELSIGPVGRVDWAPEFREVRGLDTIDFVQDLTLGASGELFVGALQRDEDGAGDAVETVGRGSARLALEAAGDTYLTLELGGAARGRAGSAEGWNASAALHAFHQLNRRNTLALSLTYDEVFEGENLPRQLNLGEDNGLRGYPAREFAGRERYRLNLEDRLDTGLSFSSFHIGLVAFYDVGWISDDGIDVGGVFSDHTGFEHPDLGDPFQSVGLGLRIGSSEVLGRHVLRLDLAFPLDDWGDEDYGPSVSFAFGQVFNFFGNRSALSTR